MQVYQREDSPNIGCDPPTMPTADYIARYVPASAYSLAVLTQLLHSHLNSYMNPNLTSKSPSISLPRSSLTLLF